MLQRHYKGRGVTWLKATRAALSVVANLDFGGRQEICTVVVARAAAAAVALSVTNLDFGRKICTQTAEEKEDLTHLAAAPPAVVVAVVVVVVVARAEEKEELTHLARQW